MKRAICIGVLLLGGSLGGAATAGTLYGILDNNYVESYDSQTLQGEGFITTVPGAEQLAVGGNNIYVASTAQVYRYDMAGDLLATGNTPAGLTVGDIALQGDVLYGVLDNAFVERYDAVTLEGQGFISVIAGNALAVGGDNIYVASTTQVYRYDMAGDLLATGDTPAGLVVGDLSLQGDVLYGVLDNGFVERYDALTLEGEGFISVVAGDGLAVGDDIYVASTSQVYRYSQAGDLLATGNTPAGLVVGDIALDTGAVPEPAAWLMMVVGFGVVGATARRRRPRPATA